MTSILNDLPWGDWLTATSAVVARGLVVLAIGGAVFLIARKRASAAARHLILIAVAFSLILLPVVSALVKPVEVRVLPVVASLASSDLSLEAGAPKRAIQVRLPGANNRIASGHTKQDSTSVGRDSAAGLPSLAVGILFLWAAGVLIGAFRMGLDYAALRRLARRCPVVDGNGLQWIQGELAADPTLTKLAVRQTPVSDRSVSVPLTWGLLPPTLLLPSQDALASWPKERVRAVILHEFAHIKRFDWITQQIAQVACMLYWFNPLVWLLCHRIKHESELACDDQAINAGISPADYAEHLVAVLRTLTVQHGSSAPARSAQAMAQRGFSVQVRVCAILDTRRNHGGLTIRFALTLLATAFVVLGSIAALRPSARALGMRSPLARENGQSDGSRNLDFRQGMLGWSITANGDNSPNGYYVVGIDPTVRRNGLPCAYLQSSAMQPKGYGALREDVPAAAYRGRRIRLSGFLRTEGVREYCGMLLSLLGPKDDRTWAMAKHPILGTTEWRRYEYVVDVPRDCWAIMLGASMKGPGKVWASEYRLEAVGTEVPVTREQPEVAAIDSNGSLGRRPQNLGFTSGLDGWYHVEEGDDSKPIAYRIGLDPSIRRGGLPMPYLTNDGIQPNGYGTMVQYFDARDYRGQRIRFSGLVRTKAVKKFAGLWLGLQKPGWTVWDGEKQPIRETTDWTNQSIVIDVPQRAEAIGIGIMVHGLGKIWASDLTVNIVNRTVPLTRPTLKLPADG